MECLLIDFRHMDDFLSDVDAVVTVYFLDFVNGDVLTFKGEWNVETSWEIEIKGNVSQKTEKITGTSKSLKDVVWAGNSSETGEKYFPSDVLKKKFNIDLFGKSEESAGEESFKDGESCTITLTFTDFEGVDTSKATLKIAAAVDETFTSKDFCMVANWDNVEQLYTNNSPSKIVTSSTNMDVVPEGKKYCILEGTDTGGKWYVDGMGFTFQQVNNRRLPQVPKLRQYGKAKQSPSPRSFLQKHSCHSLRDEKDS